MLQTNRYLLGQLNPAPQDYIATLVLPPSFVDPTASLSRSVVGPHASIGAGAKLDGVVIADSIVGEEVAISNATLTGSILSAGATVNAKARRLNIGATSALADEGDEL